MLEGLAYITTSINQFGLMRPNLKYKAIHASIINSHKGVKVAQVCNMNNAFSLTRE